MGGRLMAAVPPGKPDKRTAEEGRSGSVLWAAPESKRQLSGDDYSAQLSRLRELRVEIQTLQDLLRRIRDGKDGLKMYEGYVQQAVHNIMDLLRDIKDGEARRRLNDIWEQMRC